MVLAASRRKATVPQAKVTIRQVADAAGVSPATVSLVFNDRPGVAADTRERVLAAGERLGYRPSLISKVFRSGRSHIIGVVVAHGGTLLWEQTYLPYYRGIIAGAAMEALEFGYSVTVLRADPSGELIGPIAPDGVIVVDSGSDNPVITAALARGIAVLAASGHSSPIDSPRLRSVGFDVGLGIPKALDALLEAGATAPAFIRGPIDDQYTDSSQLSYEQWCAARGAEPFVFTLAPEQTPIDGGRAFIEAVRGRFDSVYSINETYANAITVAAGEAGIDVPGEFAIAHAGESRAAVVDPRMIYLNIDPIALGAMSARTLIDMLEGREPADLWMPPEITSASPAPGN